MLKSPDVFYSQLDASQARISNPLLKTRT